MWCAAISGTVFQSAPCTETPTYMYTQYTPVHMMCDSSFHCYICVLYMHIQCTCTFPHTMYTCTSLVLLCNPQDLLECLQGVPSTYLVLLQVTNMIVCGYTGGHTYTHIHLSHRWRVQPLHLGYRWRVQPPHPSYRWRVQPPHPSYGWRVQPPHPSYGWRVQSPHPSYGWRVQPLHLSYRWRVLPLHLSYGWRVQPPHPSHRWRVQPLWSVCISLSCCAHVVTRSITHLRLVL